jgi:hypothetical protein
VGDTVYILRKRRRLGVATGERERGGGERAGHGDKIFMFTCVHVDAAPIPLPFFYFASGAGGRGDMGCLYVQ